MKHRQLLSTVSWTPGISEHEEFQIKNQLIANLCRDLNSSVGGTQDDVRERYNIQIAPKSMFNHTLAMSGDMDDPEWAMLALLGYPVRYLVEVNIIEEGDRFLEKYTLVRHS